MKIRLINDGGYQGLANVQFPVEVNVLREGYNIYHVAYEDIADLPGWFFHEHDIDEGMPYCFYKEEVELVSDDTAVKEKKSLSDLFGENLTDEGRATLQEAGDAAAKELSEKVFGPAEREERKALLLQLVQDYGVAINDGCYESERGSLQAMAACHEEEKRLLKEIIKMIEEGV